MFSKHLHIRLTQLMCLSCCVGPSSWPSWARLSLAGSCRGPGHDYGPEGPGPGQSLCNGRGRTSEREERESGGRGEHSGGGVVGRRIYYCKWSWLLYSQLSSFNSSFSFPAFFPLVIYRLQEHKQGQKKDSEVEKKRERAEGRKEGGS